VRKSKDIKALFEGDSGRLTSLKARSRARSLVLSQVMTALPPDLAKAVATAGIENGRLTVGVTGAAWASRLRYMTETLRAKITESAGEEIRSVRIKVVQRPV
jgi:hypothetical protein